MASRGTRKYIASFQRASAIYEETIALLNLFTREGNWRAVKEKVFQENILKKSSSIWIKDILGAVERRFFVDHLKLPSSAQISKFVSSNISKPPKIQALYQYICNSDPLIDRLINGLVGPLLLKYGTSKLTKETYYEFLEKEAKRHPELRSWSPSVYGKWQRSFFAFLRSSGVMDKDPSFMIKKPIIRAEPFTFFLYGLLDKGASAREAIKNSLWERYFMSQNEIEDMLSSAQERGWLEYRRLGTILELMLSYPSLERWLNDALG